MKAFQVQVGDIIRLTNTRFGWSNKEFEVVTWDFGLQDDYDIQVNLSLREISESVFDEGLTVQYMRLTTLHYHHHLMYHL